MTTTDRFTPTSLRDIVERGHNPLDYLAPGHDLDSLIDELQRATMIPPRGRAVEAQRIYEQLEWMLAERHTGVQMALDPDAGLEERAPDAFARITQSWRWHFDLLTDPDLIDRVVECLPRREALRARAEVHKARHPHPFVVKVMQRWDACDGCAGPLPPGAHALRIGTQDGYSDDPDIEALVWCPACVTYAAGELKAVEG